MNTGKVVYEIKKRIKELSEDQKLLKRARKTTIDRSEFEAIRARFAPDKDWWNHHSAAGMVRDRKILITAYLNFYHEIRGSEYRHNTPPKTDYVSLRFYNKVSEEITEEMTKCI